MKKSFCAVLGSILLGLAPAAHSLEISVAATGAAVDKAQFQKVVEQYLPDQVKALDNGYQLFGVMETFPGRENDSFYFYSLMLHKKIIDRDSGKAYWAQTGGLRAHGVVQNADELLKQLKDSLKAASGSFHTDQ